MREKSDIRDLSSCQDDELYVKLRAKKGGLTADEAAQRLKEHGPNVLPEQRKPLFIVKFFELLRNLFNVLLLVAAGLSFFVGITTHDATSNQMGLAIVGVVIISILFTIFQENRAEKAVDAIRDLVPRNVKVMRDGQLKQLPASEIVPGDTVYLEEGDKVPADVRVVDSFHLSIDNSILTGESDLQRRSAECSADFAEDLYKCRNILFAGTTVGSGNGTAVVLVTGADTEFGRIVTMAQGVEESKSPLQKELDGTARLNFIAAISVGIIFFIASMLFLHLSFMMSILFMIGVMICLVPEGLQITVTLSLALSSQAMSKRNVVVKRLSSVETLGSCTVICSDKTGTITEGQMTVRMAWIGGDSFSVTGEGYGPEGIITREGEDYAVKDRSDINSLCMVAALDNTATIVPPLDRRKSRWTAVGDSTDAALLVLAAKAGLLPKKLMTEQPRVEMIPFDSIRKMMTSIHRNGNSLISYTKGAGQSILSGCDKAHWHGNIVPLTDEIRKAITVQMDTYAKGAFRVLALANRELPEGMKEYTSESVETGMTFIGLVAIYDPPRPEVPEGIHKARTAGIRIVMITGDHELTAEAIARKVGIISGGDFKIMTGSILATLSDEELKRILDTKELVFARITPEQKLRIVKAFREKGEIVAVTGDGVNDAPALLEADIGIAMGMAGTDVARESADIVLLDDNFASIVNGIEEGRAVFDNLKKFIVYVFCHNWAEMVAFLAFVLLGCPLPLAVIQVLLIDLFLEIPPSLSLTSEPPEPGIMERPPRKKGSRLFDKWALARSAYIGLFIGMYVLSWVFFYWSQNGWQMGESEILDNNVYLKGMTIMTVGIMAGQLGTLFAMRTSVKSAFISVKRNKWLVASAVISLVLMFVVIHIPVVNVALFLSPIDPIFWLALYLFAPVVFVSEEIRKAVLRVIVKPSIFVPPAVPFVSQPVPSPLVGIPMVLFVERSKPIVILTGLVPGDEDALSIALTMGKQNGSKVYLAESPVEAAKSWMKDKLRLLAEDGIARGIPVEHIHIQAGKAPNESLRNIIHQFGAETLIVPISRDVLLKRGRLLKNYSWLKEFSDRRIILVSPGKETRKYTDLHGFRMLIPVLDAYHQEPFELAALLSENAVIPDVDVIVAKVVEMPTITPLYSIYRPESLVDKEKQMSFLQNIKGWPLFKIIHSKVLLVRSTARDLTEFARDRKVDIIIMQGDWSTHGFITKTEHDISEMAGCTVAVVLPSVGKAS